MECDNNSILIFPLLSFHFLTYSLVVSHVSEHNWNLVLERQGRVVEEENKYRVPSAAL